MTHSTSDSYYLDGLQDANPEVIEQIYREFRSPVVRAVQAAGGSPADGALFLQLAMLEAAALARTGTWPVEVPFFDQLRALALGHFADWLAERGQSVHPSEATETPADSSLEQNTAEPFVPASGELRRTRHKIFAWKTLDRLDTPCRDSLLQARPDSADEQPPADGPCLEQWRNLLFVSSAPADAPGEPAALPDWAEAARRDVAGYELWRRVDALERRVSTEETAVPPRRGRRLPIILGSVFVALIAWALYQRFGGGTSPGEVYRDNFSMPASIIEDMRARYAADTSEAVIERPLDCDALLEEADRYFSTGDYAGASGPLTDLLDDSYASCHSDAYYYLGLIALSLHKPDVAVQCFAKIEDLENFGQDIYWYQALALVQMAERNPGLRERAERAVKLAVANSRDETRRQQAEAMLKQLLD